MRARGIFGVVALCGGCSFNQFVEQPEPVVFRGERFSGHAPPVSGGTLAVVEDPENASRAFVVAAIPEADAIHVVTVARDSEEARTKTIALSPGDEPGRVVGDGAGRAHVALRGSGDLVTIDAVRGIVLARRRACDAPRGVAYDAAIDAVHVACATGELVTLPAAGGNASRRILLDRDLRDVVVVSPARTFVRSQGPSPSPLLVSRFRSAQILRLDSSGAIAARFDPPGSNTRQAHVAWRMTATADGAMVSYQMEKTMPVDITTDTSSQKAAPYGGGSVALNPDDPNGPIVLPVLAAVGGDGIQVNSTTVFFGATPSVDVAVSKKGLTAVAAGNMVTLSDHGPPIRQFGNSSELPGSYRQVTAVAFLELGAPIVVSLWRGGSPGYEIGLVFSATAPTRVPRPVSFRGVADTGLDIFQTPTKGGIACASCHPEGGDDGHTWTFRTAEGPITRRTQSLRGGILGTAPFHWDGDMSGMRAICDGVFSKRMGGEHVDDGQLAILERFLDSIPRLPPRAGLDAERVERGRSLFEGRGGCAGCHSGEHFTSNASADVGKGTALQIPQLVSIGDRAPFMHDGCATTLLDRFDPSCGGARHGNQDLTREEQQDLVDYLESL